MPDVNYFCAPATTLLVEGVCVLGGCSGGSPGMQGLLRGVSHGALHPPRGPSPEEAPPRRPDFDVDAAISAWIETARFGADGWLETMLTALGIPGKPSGPRWVVLAGNYFALCGRHRVDPRSVLFLAEDGVGEVLSEDDDSASFTGSELTLSRHLADVGAQARAYAEHLGLPAALVADLTLAARLHDVGKADPRFQQMLVGGSDVRLAMLDEPLAKSNGDASDSASRRRARRRSDYPQGYRHELLSVAMLTATPEALERAHDPELVLHLVGSHHGWCRPFAPAVDHGPSFPVALELGQLTLRGDTAHGLARFDAGVGDRFFNLIERYGWWGLAWLEALVRLADHRASEAARDRAPAGDVCQQASA